MKTIVNKTHRPLKISLSRGRMLRLGPRKEGQIATSDVERESVKQSVARGDVEIFDDSAQTGTSSVSVSGSGARAQGHQARFSGGKRGDR